MTTTITSYTFWVTVSVKVPRVVILLLKLQGHCKCKQEERGRREEVSIASKHNQEVPYMSGQEDERRVLVS